MPEPHLQPLVAVTMGDPVGIGPEIIVKALQDEALFTWCRPVVFGDRGVLNHAAGILGLPFSPIELTPDTFAELPPEQAGLYPVSNLDLRRVVCGNPTPATGQAMADCIVAAVDAARAARVDALVTGPINKVSLHSAGFQFPGHTEMLASLTGTRDVVMMLAGETLRVALVTIHCALREVPDRLTSDSILKTIRITHDSLQRYFAVAHPRLAVAGLNPHAGESGRFGREESTIIAPAVAQARKLGIQADGPLPADTLFYQAARGRFDAVVCMYHDQGLIPLKLLHFADGVNVTLGLPVIRTSVDHGTAYDIAGTGAADPASLLCALRMAARMAGARALSCR